MEKKEIHKVEDANSSPISNDENELDKKLLEKLNKMFFTKSFWAFLGNFLLLQSH